ncbi:MAG: M23 family metallopeptidase, partial [Anaerolineae bacterium]|nr:M23 family metallopeptidase [Anaerolineae bacterium]
MAFRMRWPTSRNVIRQRFGEHPAVYNKFGLPGHEGVDLVAPYGSAVSAAADGFVSDVRLDGFSDPMLKPYGNQVRLQHVDGYETIYAHLSQVVVVRGQLVKAGQVIGLAGDTGHAAGPHLHLGLKHYGATVNGETAYPYDLIDPEPFLRNGPDDDVAAFDAGEPSMQVEVDSVELGFLNLHVLPRRDADILQSVAHGALLDALEDAAAVRRKVGTQGQWLWVRTPDGTRGWAPAWYVKLPDGVPEPPEDLDSLVVVVVDSPDEVVWLRKGPGVAFPKVIRLRHGTSLRALQALGVVEDRVGQRGAWLRVLAPTGDVGYCEAWHLKVVPFGEKPVLPEPPIGEPTEHVVVDSPDLGLRLRAGPGTNYEKVWWMPHGMVLSSLEDPDETGAKVGRFDAWIHVRTPAHHEGYAAAWYLRHPDAQDERQRVNAAELPKGLSPHIFGIHAVSVADDAYTREGIQSLYAGTGKQGWILFTEICGRHAHTIRLVPEIRQRLWAWAEAGYGVIVRLNHGYEPGGTLPES